jgi:hypothetical protein
VSLRKVKAHSGDIHNEAVDKLAKSSLYSPALQLNIENNDRLSLSFNDFPIALPIRYFLKNLNRADTLCSFLNLDIIAIYDTHDINWMITARYISDNIANSFTTYEASTLKAKKLQRLLELLPTMEVLKKRHPLIYNTSWKCFRCHAENEDFSHIWTCISVQAELFNIIELSKQHLIQCTNSNIDILVLNNMDIWKLSTLTNLSFLDLIKGVVPTSLHNIFSSAFGSMEESFSALSNFMHFMYEQSQKICIKHCSLMKDFEKMHQITDPLKRSLIESTGYAFPVNINNNRSSFTLIDYIIRLGSYWSNF